MLDRFAALQSKALQQTLFEMGRAVLEAFPYLAEIRLQAPNKHHFLFDLDRFGIPNRGEVFHADDRPYGLMHVTVQREDAPRCRQRLGRVHRCRVNSPARARFR